MKIFKTRNQLLNLLPKNLKIAELGVFKAEFSDLILHSMQPNELHLVDIWAGTFGSGDKDGLNHTVVEDMSKVHQNICEKYSSNKSIQIHKKNTLDFLSIIPDNYFDMIYVDADHSFSAVVNDLMNSFPKIKHNGFLCGHDYVIGSEVAQAVQLFCRHYNQVVDTITSDGCPSFVITLNKN